VAVRVLLVVVTTLIGIIARVVAAPTSTGGHRETPKSLAAVVYNGHRRAERIAHTIDDPYPQAQALAEMATALAPTDPTRAEQIARTITRPSGHRTCTCRCCRGVDQ
jgi:hypothetical protein